MRACFVPARWASLSMTLPAEWRASVRVGAKYSHLNGEEYLLVHKPALWREVQGVIAAVNAEACKIKVSKEKRMEEKALFAPKAMNQAFKQEFVKHG